MRFDLSEEQVMIQDGVADAFKDAYAVLRAYKSGEFERVAQEIAPRLEPLGLRKALVPESLGGLGYGYIEAFVIAMEGGRYCMPVPIKETLLVAKALSRHGANENFVEGLWFTASLDRPRALTVAKEAGTLRINGRLDAVPFAALSSHVLVNVSGPDATNRLLVLLDLSKATVQPLGAGTLDLAGGMSSIQFEDHETTTANIVCQDEQVGTALKELQLGGALLAAAEIAGAARACLDMTVDYLGTRRTFGKLLGANQLLRHRASDDFVAVESIRMATQYASALLEEGSPEAGSAVSGAKVLAGTLGVTTAENSLQSHGAIGFTWEFPLHLFLRRILRLRAEFGSPAEHRQRLFESLPKKC